MWKKGKDVIVVQEVIPAVKMYKATAAWVITNSTYTKQALTLAKHNQVRMIDREMLIQMSLEMKSASI